MWERQNQNKVNRQMAQKLQAKGNYEWIHIRNPGGFEQNPTGLCPVPAIQHAY